MIPTQPEWATTRRTMVKWSGKFFEGNTKRIGYWPATIASNVKHRLHSTSLPTFFEWTHESYVLVSAFVFPRIHVFLRERGRGSVKPVIIFASSYSYFFFFFFSSPGNKIFCRMNASNSYITAKKRPALSQNLFFWRKEYLNKGPV